MDDEEYYRKMREQYSHGQKITKSRNSCVTDWNLHQGREDAQMLQEKKSSSDSILSEDSDNSEE